MKKRFSKRLRDRKARMFWKRLVSALSCVVVFCTTYALILPAISMEKNVYCGIEEHQHDESCYEERLICGMEEAEAHHHTDACYTIEKQLICGEKEHTHGEGCYDEEGNLTCALEEHSHSDECYREDRILSCHLEETDGHTHTADCYEKVLICEREVHTHSKQCYVKKGTDTSENGGAGTQTSDETGSSAASGNDSGSKNDFGSGNDSASEAAESSAGSSAGSSSGSLDDPSSPSETVNLAQFLSGQTSLWYREPDGGEYDWEKITGETTLGADDLVRLYFAYTIPAGTLDENNAVTSYPLPDNILFTDEQLEIINTANDDLGIEAVEGTRLPDEEPAGEEYVSARFKIENVTDEDNNLLSQNAVLTFDPYTIDKNRDFYDENGSLTDEGEDVYGFFAIDVHPDQIDFEKTSSETVKDTVETDEGLVDKTIEKTLSEAEIVLVQKNKGLGIKENSRTVRLEAETLVEEKLRSADEDLKEEAGEEGGQDAAGGQDKDAADATDGRGAADVQDGSDASNGQDAAGGQDMDAADASDGEEDTDAPGFMAGELTFKGPDYTVIAAFDKEAEIPAGSVLSVSEITQEDAAYQEYRDQAEKAATEKKAEGKAAWVRLFDISIVNNGEVIEPAGPVSVQINYHEAMERPKNAEVKTVHFEGEKETPRVLGTEAEGSETSVEQVKFDTDSFSVFAIVGTTIEKTVLASDGNNYRISVTYGDEAAFPEGAELEVREILQSKEGEDSESDTDEYSEYAAKAENALGMEEGSAGYIRLFDIKIVDRDNHSIHYQPAEGSSVDVKIELADAKSGSLSVVHFGDDSEDGEKVDAVTGGQTVSFAADGFSIYAVVDDETTGENARIGYRFRYNDGSQNVVISTQYFRYKDVHPANGETPLTINEPSIPGIEDSTWNRIFRGWSKTSFDDADENLTTVEVLNTELSALAEEDYVEGTYIDLYANLENVYYVTYVDINPNNVLATEIVPVAETGDTVFTVKSASELRPAIDADTELEGWYDINQPDVIYTPGQENVVLNANLTLYPKVEGGNWLVFNDNDLIDDGNGNMVSGGASFTPPAFYLNEVTEEPAAPTWTGYEFGGWYQDSACTTPFTFGGTLTHDTTVYAKWTPSDSACRVIIWKQRTSNGAGISDDEKTYDYVTSYLIDDVVTGETLDLDPSYTRLYGTNGTSTDADKAFFLYNSAKTDQSVVIKADGSSVLNVYYDRKPVTLNYYTYTYGYNETTGNNGTQYGLVDGEYVRLTRDGTTWTYTTGEYEYTSTTSTSNYITQYGLVDGEYVELTRHGRNTSNYYWTYGDTWYSTGTRYNGTRYTRTEVTETYTGTRYTRSNNQSWQIYKSFTGLYGSTLEENGYTWPAEYDWYSNGHGTGGNAETSWSYGSGDVSGTRTTFMSSFLPTDVNTTGSSISVNFYGSNPSGSSHIHFYTENADGTYTERDTIATTGGTFYITDKYIGYHASAYRADNGTEHSAGNKGSNGYYNNGSGVPYNNNLYIYFDLNDRTLTFYTNNGSNQLIDYTVPYNQSLSGYANQSPGQRAGYYFLGWYADPGCTEAFDFTQAMPDNNIAVYGKWKLRRVRVVIEPGADNVNMGSQATKFRLDYDERIDGGLLESAARAGYILDGWYTDPEFTNRFLFSSPVNDDTTDVAWDYQDSSRWAAARAAYGDDAEAYENVRGILHLYAKWILDPNSTGINVIYDPGDAAVYDTLGTLLTTVPIDSHMYGFDGTATTREAPTNYSDLYTFKYWEATLTDGTTKIFYPGDPIALAELIPTETIYDETSGEELRHTVTLRAVYDLTGDPARQTSITYDGNTFSDTLYNGTTKEMQGKTSDGTERITIVLDKEVNQNIELPSADDFYLEGWELVGWSFTQGTYAEQVAAAAADPDAPNFEPGQTVAADNLVKSDLNDQGNTLYAMWQPKKYNVTVRQVVENDVPVNNFIYTYKTGVESEISGAVETVQTLTGDSSFTVDNLEYYERVGHVIHIETPEISDTESYSVRVNAVVTKDDGTTETLNPTAAGDYQILGDVTITYTYSPKVEVKLQKRDAADHSTVLTGAEFTFTPVEFNAATNHWENAGEGTTLTVDGETLTKYLQEGTYRITETTAPGGYAAISDELFLTISHDSAFTLFTASGGAVNADVAELDDTGKVLTIYDNPIRTVTLSKRVVDETGFETDRNFTFTVTLFESDGTTRLRNYKVGEELITNNIGVVTIDLADSENVVLNVPNGCMIAVAETVNSSYETSYQWNSETPVSGNTFGSDSEPIQITEDDSTLTFTNRRITQKLKIRKITDDVQETGLAGATFNLTAASGRTIEGFTDLTGLVSMDENAGAANLGYLPGSSGSSADDTTLFILAGGTYTLTETAAPAHYTGLEEGFDITVSSEGVTIPEGTEGVTISEADSDGVYTITVVNHKKAVPIKIVKIDQLGKALEGAEFSISGEGITAQAGLVSRKTSTEADAEAVIYTNAAVPEGTYTLTETGAPDGYNSMAGDAVITVAPAQTGSDLIVTVKINGEDISNNLISKDVTSGEWTIKIMNTAGYELPSTGGPGTRIFTILGGMLIALAGVLLEGSRRKC